HIDLPQLLPAVLCDRLDHKVASLMTVAVVDGLEGVDIQHDGREQAAVALESLKLSFREAEELPTVQQAGEAVGRRQLPQVGEQLEVFRHHGQLPDEDECRHGDVGVQQTAQRIQYHVTTRKK